MPPTNHKSYAMYRVMQEHSEAPPEGEWYWTQSNTQPEQPPFPDVWREGEERDGYTRGERLAGPGVIKAADALASHFQNLINCIEYGSTAREQAVLNAYRAARKEGK